MLTISQVTKAFAGRTLFEDASLQVNRGDRVGLVGPNGAGKSTLFSLILGEDLPDQGQITLERSTRLGFLPQEHAAAGEESVLELACAVSPELTKAQRILKYYLRLLRYAWSAKPKIFHILWNDRFQVFDRTALMLYYKLLRKRVVFTAHNVNAAARDN